MRRIATVSILFLTFSLSSSFAFGFGKPQLRLTELYRYDLRSPAHQLYNTRLSLGLDYLDKQQNVLFKAMPFFEIRRNINRSIWERQEIGVEFGKNIFSWLYFGESIQAAWLKEDYRSYTRNKGRQIAESETRFCFTRDLFDNGRIKLKGFLLDEYTYDFDIGAATRNEIALGIITPFNKNIETGINWRHIDRIHDFDSDAIETSVTLIF